MIHSEIIWRNTHARMHLMAVAIGVITVLAFSKPVSAADTSYALKTSTYLPGSGNATSVAVDAQGNIYVAGTTISIDLPATSGAFQPSAHPTKYLGVGYVMKLTPDASKVLWASYTDDGDGGGGAGLDVAIDAAGNPYVLSTSCSTTLSVTTTLHQIVDPLGNCDSYVTKLTPDGTKVLYRTKLGIGFSDSKPAFAVRPNGNVIIGVETKEVFPGLTLAPAQPVRGESTIGGKNLYLLELNSEGSKLASAYLGVAAPIDVALDHKGNVYLYGFANQTNSQSLPSPTLSPTSLIKSWNYGFVAKLSPDLNQLMYLDRIAGTPNTGHLVVDTAESAHVVGTTLTDDLPTTENAIQTKRPDTVTDHTPFIVQLSPDGTHIEYASYLSSQSKYPDTGMAIGVTDSGRTVVAGAVTGPQFPLVQPLQAYDQLPNGGGFISVFNTDHTLIFSTLLGGVAMSDMAVIGEKIIMTGTGVGGFSALPLVHPLQRAKAAGVLAIIEPGTAGTAQTVNSPNQFNLVAYGFYLLALLIASLIIRRRLVLNSANIQSRISSVLVGVGMAGTLIYIAFLYVRGVVPTLGAIDNLAFVNLLGGSLPFILIPLAGALVSLRRPGFAWLIWTIALLDVGGGIWQLTGLFTLLVPIFWPFLLVGIVTIVVGLRILARPKAPTTPPSVLT